MYRLDFRGVLCRSFSALQLVKHWPIWLRQLVSAEYHVSGVLSLSTRYEFEMYQQQLAGAAILLLNKERWATKSCLQCGEICSARSERRAMASIVPLLSMDDGGRLGQFANFCWVDSATFEFIPNKVGPLISNQRTSMRALMSARERLAITLRNSATGQSMTNLHYEFKQGTRHTCDYSYKFYTVVS